jgi:hypothetical protein
VRPSRSLPGLILKIRSGCVVLLSVMEKVNYISSINDTPLECNVSRYWRAYLISSDTAKDCDEDHFKKTPAIGDRS